MCTFFFADALERCIFLSFVFAESVCFVDDYEVVFFGFVVSFDALFDFVEAAVGDEVCACGELEVFECVFPVLLDGWWIDYEDVCVRAVGEYESSCYHGSDDCFSQSDDVGQEEAVVVE